MINYDCYQVQKWARTQAMAIMSESRFSVILLYIKDLQKAVKHLQLRHRTSSKHIVQTVLQALRPAQPATGGCALFLATVATLRSMSVATAISATALPTATTAFRPALVYLDRD